MMRWLAFWMVAMSPLGAAERPHVLVLLCDDLGYGDLACYGHPIIETPNLDALAASGVRCTDFYSAAPVCSPSRVGLLTGRSPNRAGVYDWIPEATVEQAAEAVGKPGGKLRPMVQMRAEEVTVAELLQQAGYATALAGKWHCNAVFNRAEQAQPGEQGFDHWLATQNNASPSHADPVNFVRNGEPVGQMEGYSCQIVVDEMIEWIGARAAGQPFFGLVTFHEPHEPVASPPELVAKYRGRASTEEEAEYFANVENVDRAVGRLMAALEEKGLREETLVVFTSDNGPETLKRYPRAERSYGRPRPLRGMKLHTHDAGFRVAGVLSWPGHITPGWTSSEVVSALDLLPTLVELAGAVPPPGRELDGVSLVKWMKGESLEREKPLLWAYYNAINEGVVAMRDGPIKVVGTLEGGMLPKTENLTRANAAMYLDAKVTSVEVYRIEEDVAESQDVANGSEQGVDWKRRLEEAYRALVKDSLIWE